MRWRVVAAAAMVAAVGASAPAGAATPAVNGLTDTSASRSFDEAKPGVVRIVTDMSEQVAIHEAEPNFDAIDHFEANDSPKVLAAAGGPGPAAANQLFADISGQLSGRPSQYFKPSSHVFRADVGRRLAGSGVIVSAGGTILTSAALVPSPDAEKGLLRSEVVASLTATVQDDLSGLTADDIFAGAPDVNAVLTEHTKQAFVTALVKGVVSESVSQLTYERTSSSSTAQVGPAEPLPQPVLPTPDNTPSGGGGNGTTTVAFRATATGSGNYPATVLYRPSATQPQVAVVAIPGNALPAVPLAEQVPAIGSAVVVAGYPSAQPDAGDQSGEVRPIRTSGAVNGSSDPLPVSASFTIGQEGGPALDAGGRIQGIAVLNGKAQAIVGVDALQAALAQAHKSASSTPSDLLWRRAMADNGRAYFKRALPILRRLEQLTPTYPYVSDAVLRDSSAVAEGKDRTPSNVPPWTAGAAVAINVLAVGGLVLVGLARRRSRTGAPAPAIL